MTDDADGSSGRRPELTLELLADFDAGVLSADEEASVRARIAIDPHAQRVLAALAATRSQLAGTPVAPVPVPPAVVEAIDTTLEAIRRDHRDGPAAGSDSVESLSQARDARRRRALALASVAAVVVAVVTLIVAVVTSTGSTDEEPARAESSSAPPGGSQAPPAQLLAVAGRSDPRLGSPTDPDSRLRRCLDANQVPGSTPVLGSGPLDGGTRTVILLATGVAGRFDALVVGANCDLGRPSLVSRTMIGVPGR